MNKWKLIVGFIFCLGVAACGQVPLHHNLEEAEADKILVLLDKNGISAEKVMVSEGQEVTWRITVPEGDVVNARRLLVENNLPARPELGLSGVYQEKGLIPTPDEQRARFLLALKGEITNALRKIPGVHEVGVVLNVPEDKGMQLGEAKEMRPSASVVLRIGESELAQSGLTEEKVKQFVANSVPEMQAGDVIVIISAIENGGGAFPDFERARGVPPPLPREAPPVESPGGAPTATEDIVEVGGIRLDSESVGQFRFYLIAFLLVLIVLSAALLVMLFRFSRLRRKGGSSRRLRALPADQQGGPGELMAPGRGGVGAARGPGGETGTGP